MNFDSVRVAIKSCPAANATDALLSWMTGALGEEG